MWNEENKQRKASLAIQFQAANGNVPQEVKDELMRLYEIENEDDIRRFGIGLDWCTKILYDNDPIDLKPQNIPSEEYDCEARMILRELAIREKPTLEEIREIVHEIFSMQFTFKVAGPADRSCYTNISQELNKNINYWKNK
jgi:hypothetical protein